MGVQIEIKKAPGRDGKPGEVIGKVTVTLAAVPFTAAAVAEGLPPPACACCGMWLHAHACILSRVRRKIRRKIRGCRAACA